jgi:hypothetical protein
MKKLLREPLFHFLILGGCLFLIAGLWHGTAPFQFGRGPAQPTKIVITPGDVDSMISNFTGLWRRPPTPQELNGLIAARIREEVYYREALKLGLDRDDSIVRGRLQEKLEFLSQDVNQIPEPSEHDLETFLSQHADQFRPPARYSFRVVFVDAGLHGAATTQDAENLLAKLRANPQPAAAAKGDPPPFPNHFEGIDESAVAKQFGNEFASALENITPREWSGPVKSPDGAYLVYLEERVAGRLPPPGEILPAVKKEWQASERRAANEKYYQGLLQRYNVSIELPKGIRAQAELTGQPLPESESEAAPQ